MDDDGDERIDDAAAVREANKEAAPVVATPRFVAAPVEKAASERRPRPARFIVERRAVRVFNGC
jgi:hypothetical protein